MEISILAKSLCVFVLFIQCTVTVSLQVSPANGQTIPLGNQWFEVSSVPAKTALVQYTISSKLIGRVSASAQNPTFKQQWNTGWLLDGSHLLEAIAYDRNGNILETAYSRLTVAFNGIMSLQWNCTVNLTQVVSGSFNCSFMGKETAATTYPAYWVWGIDGYDGGVIYTDNVWANPVSVKLPIKTAGLQDGKHWFYMGVHSINKTGSDVSYFNYRGAVSFVFTTQNAAPQQIVSNYEHVYLTPGESATLQCFVQYNNNTKVPCTSPNYQINLVGTRNTTIISSSLNGGSFVITGVSEGFSYVQINDSSNSNLGNAMVKVWVKTSAYGVPHFLINGAYSTTASNDSLFVVAPFVLTPSDLMANATLLSEVQKAGVNTISSGFYNNPRNIGYSYSSWKSNYDSSYIPGWNWSAQKGFSMLLVGDDAARRQGDDAWYTLNWPSAPQALKYAVDSLVSTKRLLAIDIVDESSGMWGNTPVPAGKFGMTNGPTQITCYANGNCTIEWSASPMYGNGGSFAIVGSVITDPNNSSITVNTPTNTTYKTSNTTGNISWFAPGVKFSVTTVLTIANDPNLEILKWGGATCNGVVCNPRVPNTIVKTLSGWMRNSSTGNISISWPALGNMTTLKLADIKGVADVATQSAWMGTNAYKEGISDYASHYVDTRDFRKLYNWGCSAANFAKWVASLFYDRQNDVLLARPQMMLISGIGIDYTKLINSSSYTPGVDQMRVPGTTAGRNFSVCSNNSAASFSSSMTAAAIGNSGLRIYAFDYSWGKSSRLSSALGTYITQPVGPWDIFYDIWKAMGYAANLLGKTWEPFLFSVPKNSPQFGRGIVSALREGKLIIVMVAHLEGSYGKMLMIVSQYENAHTINVNVNDYAYSGGSIVKYSAWAYGINVSNGASDTNSVTIKSAGVVTYLFLNSTSSSPVTTVSFSNPSPCVSVSIKIGYIYNDDLAMADSYECTSGCQIPIDFNLGTVFYQYQVFNGNNFVLSGTQTLSPSTNVAIPSSTCPSTSSTPSRTASPSASPSKTSIRRSASPSAKYSAGDISSSAKFVVSYIITAVLVVFLLF